MSIVVSLNREKYKAGNSIRDLVKENTRDEKTASHYDNGIRNIDINKTKLNVIFEMPKGNIDKFRNKQTEILNEERKNNGMRKMRSDYIDVIGNVYQPSKGFEKLTREQQIEHFRTVYEVIKNNPHEYGDVFSCAVHFDETTPHMQILTFAQNANDPTRNAKNMFGNKTQMSNFQTEFVEKLRSAGLDVERGIKRIDNPEYENFKVRAKTLGFEVNRHNDKQIADFMNTIRKQQIRLNKRSDQLDEERKKINDSKLNNAKREAELQQREVELQTRENNYIERERKLKQREDKYNKIQTNIKGQIFKALKPLGMTRGQLQNIKDLKSIADAGAVINDVIKRASTKQLKNKINDSLTDFNNNLSKDTRNKDNELER